MSILASSVVSFGALGGIVSRILSKSVTTLPFSQCARKSSPLSAGPRSPERSSLWHPPQRPARKFCLPRSACAVVKTPSHVVFFAILIRSSSRASAFSSSLPAGMPVTDMMYERMSAFAASSTSDGPSCGIVSRIFVKRPPSGSFSHFDQNTLPLSAGPRCEPASSMLWQRAHERSNGALPRAACTDVKTPSHTFFSTAGCWAVATASAVIQTAATTPTTVSCLDMSTSSSA